MTDYRSRQLTYRPLTLVDDAEQIIELGLVPDLIRDSTGPDAVVVYVVEMGAPHPTTPILPSMAEFDARFEAI